LTYLIYYDNFQQSLNRKGVNEMAIIRHEYFKGKVQSLEFRCGGKKRTVGVVEPGTYDFKIAETDEIIQVIEGTLVINGVEYKWNSQACFIHKGEQVIIENQTEEDAAYEDTFGEEEADGESGDKEDD